MLYRILVSLVLFFIMGEVTGDSAHAVENSGMFSLNLPAGGSVTGRLMQILMLLTVLTLAPSLLIMITCFTRIVVVLAFMRSALGLQQSPPNVILISLALFLTFFVMQPSLEQMYNEAVLPLIEERIDEKQAFKNGVAPFHKFMRSQVRAQDLQLFTELAHLPALGEPEDIPLRILLPAFLITELRRAFEIGFLLFLPFLVIDLVVSSILMAMGMMMLPPVTIALPIKLIFFVLMDGWYMLCGSLVRSFH